MIKIENTEVFGWESAIRGMRNPMNSWDKSDSWYGCRRGDYGHIDSYDCEERCKCDCEFCVGSNDLKLMESLVQAGSDHSKFMRMINVTLDITAPLYWWKEFDTYKVGTVRNSCSTMHKVTEKEFTLDDFSCEKLLFSDKEECKSYTLIHNGSLENDPLARKIYPKSLLLQTIAVLNANRNMYLKTKDKKYWWQMIQLLPSSYNQRATIQLNYAVLRNIYHSRKNHKLDEWHVFCEWIETLPYSELITATKSKAKWLKTDYTLCAFEQCSACGWQGRVCTEFCDKATKKYCPNCGAEMEINNG